MSASALVRVLPAPTSLRIQLEVPLPEDAERLKRFNWHVVLEVDLAAGETRRWRATGSDQVAPLLELPPRIEARLPAGSRPLSWRVEGALDDGVDGGPAMCFAGTLTHAPDGGEVPLEIRVGERPPPEAPSPFERHECPTTRIAGGSGNAVVPGVGIVQCVGAERWLLHTRAGSRELRRVAEALAQLPGEPLPRDPGVLVGGPRGQLAATLTRLVPRDSFGHADHQTCRLLFRLPEEARLPWPEGASDGYALFSRPPHPSRRAFERSDERVLAPHAHHGGHLALVCEDQALGTREVLIDETYPVGPLEALDDGRVLYAGAEDLWLWDPDEGRLLRMDVGEGAWFGEAFTLTREACGLVLWSADPERFRMELPAPG